MVRTVVVWVFCLSLACGNEAAPPGNEAAPPGNVSPGHDASPGTGQACVEGAVQCFESNGDRCVNGQWQQSTNCTDMGKICDRDNPSACVATTRPPKRGAKRADGCRNADLRCATQGEFGSDFDGASLLRCAGGKWTLHEACSVDLPGSYCVPTGPGKAECGYAN